MELKFKRFINDLERPDRFNCTIMELKCKRFINDLERPDRFNCTIMELKSNAENTLTNDLAVLIVPLWN